MIRLPSYPGHEYTAAPVQIDYIPLGPLDVPAREPVPGPCTPARCADRSSPLTSWMSFRRSAFRCWGEPALKQFPLSPKLPSCWLRQA